MSNLKAGDLVRIVRTHPPDEAAGFRVGQVLVLEEVDLSDASYRIGCTWFYEGQIEAYGVSEDVRKLREAAEICRRHGYDHLVVGVESAANNINAARKPTLLEAAEGLLYRMEDPACAEHPISSFLHGIGVASLREAIAREKNKPPQ